MRRSLMSSTFSILSANNTTQFALDGVSRQAGRADLVASVPATSEANPGASTIVELGSSSAVAMTYTAELPRLQKVWASGAGGDAVSQQIAYNFSASDAAHRLKGLGATLLEGYKGEAGSYRQALLSFNGVEGSPAAEQARQVADLELQVIPTHKFALTLKTQSGATVELMVASRPDGLGVEFKTSQTLTDKELKAVRELADGFEAAVKGLTEQPPRIAIDALSRFDSSAITSLDLRASFSKEAGPPLSLAFSATSAGRKLSVETETGALNLSVDLGNAEIRGDRAQREKAMSNYLSQVDTAARRGNGDQALVALFKNAFSEVHAYYPDDSHQVSRRVLRDYESAALSGLADFTASIKGTPVASNPMRPGEVDYFNYATAQESILTAGDRTKLIQTQLATLDAAFHKGLKSDKAPVLTSDPRSQNYRYFQINDRISSKVTIEHDERGPVRADLEQSATQMTNIQTYVRGKLTHEEHIPQQRQVVIDLLESIKNLSLEPGERQRQLTALNDKVMLQA